MKIKTVIIDDELNARKALLNMLDFYCPEIEVVGESIDVAGGVHLIESVQPKLVFLDIKMPDGTGFDLLRKLPKVDFRVIFVTAYDQFALSAIKMSAVDYLLKPLNPHELKAAVNKAVALMDKDIKLADHFNVLEENLADAPQMKKIILNTSNSMHVVRIENIIRCEADENYTKILTSDQQSILVSKTLKEFDELLSPYGFCRIHQSHLINLNQVITYEKGMGGMVLLKNKERIPVSGRRKDFFIKALEQLT